MPKRIPTKPLKASVCCTTAAKPAAAVRVMIALAPFAAPMFKELRTFPTHAGKPFFSLSLKCGAIRMITAAIPDTRAKEAICTIAKSRNTTTNGIIASAKCGSFFALSSGIGSQLP